MFSGVRWIVPALLLISSTAGPAFADLAKLDPRARVALSMLRDGVTVEAAKARGASISNEGTIDAFIVGPVSRHELEAAGAQVRTEVPGGIFTADIPASAVEAVAALAGVRRIEGSAPVELETDLSVPSTGANLLRGAGPEFTGLNGQGVLIGAVDSGIDFDHQDFKDASGLTRLVSLWDQTNAAGPGPAPFGYGTEWSSAQIDGGACTEVDVDLDGHGTMVMGITGGDGSGTGGAILPFTYVGMAPQASLCLVKPIGSNSAVLDGVQYVFNRAAALGLPAVCNLSLGAQSGPRDGTSAYEAALSALSGPGRIIVVSAGNYRGQALHAEVFAAGAGTNATMQISGSLVNRAVFINGYYEASENLNVQITTPTGTVLGPVPVGGTNAAFPGAATASGRVFLENGVSLTATGDKQVFIVIQVESGQSMNGTWTFRFIPVALGAANGEVDLWRYFNSAGSTANFVVGNQPLEEMVTEPGNALNVITVGAYSSKQFFVDCNGINQSLPGGSPVGTLAGFSSPGPTRDGRQKPELSAPGTAIAATTSFDPVVTCGVGPSPKLGDGMQHRVAQGTSLSAPHVTGAVALILQKYGPLTTPEFVTAFLQNRARVDGFTGAVWNKDWGRGKLFLGDMIDPTVAVLAPNGGEVHQLGAVVNLLWNANDALGGVTAVDLELSRSGPAGPWETIATGVPNTGSYEWLASGPATALAILRVRASDAAGNTGVDDSDQTWTLEPSVTAVFGFYDAESVDGVVELRWQFGDRDAGGHVVVERSEQIAGPYTPIPVERRTEGSLEIAVDRTTEPGRTYFYRLVLDGSPVGPITVRTDDAFTEFAIGRIAPNPSTGGPLDIMFTVARDARVSLAVYDLRGRKVADLVDTRYAPGRYTARWDGSRVASGLYFVRFVSPDGEKTARVILNH
jgi:subtilisin family serine protease